MAKILLSICIPTYNFGKFIPEVLDSILADLPEQVEIIIGDGGSTDNTAEIIAPFVKNSRQIKYFNFRKKSGIDIDIEKTLKQAKGKYCWLLSADDAIPHGAIKEILSELKSNHSVYLFNRVDCDINLNPICKKKWLNINKNQIFNFDNPDTIKYYFDSSNSLGALFSYISSFIFLRKSWEITKTNKLMLNSNYSHAYKIFKILNNGNSLNYLNKEFVKTRLFNDSFAINGAIARCLIDLIAYLRIADLLFKNEDLNFAFKKVMTRSRRWYTLIKVASDCKTSSEWNHLTNYLIKFGYLKLDLKIVYFLSRFNFFNFLSRIAKQTLILCKKFFYFINFYE